MSNRETAKIIDDAAADWAAKLDRGLSDPEQDELEEWLSADARRVGALARARAIWSHAEYGLARGGMQGAAERLEPPSARVAQPPPLLTRRRLIGGGIAVAASVALVPFLRESSEEMASDVGEVRRIGLEDGSSLTLGASSRIRQAFSASERLIEILAGEAFFEVVHDPVRPFVVLAKGMTLRAAGTIFGVRMLAGLPFSILVKRGRVRVTGPTLAPTLLDENMRLDISTSAGPGAARVTTIEPDALDRALAWRDGMLSFEGDTLTAAVAQFDRYGPVRFEIADRALAHQRITGLFAANDPKGFARAIAPSLNARAEIEGNRVRLSPQRAAN